MPMRIGDFAGRTGATVKALRHYDEIGLLRPAAVDATTGYRMYTQDQEKLVAWIQILQNLRFSLAEIRRLLNGPADAEALLGQLKHKRVELAEELEHWITRRVQIDRLIRLVEQEGFVMDRKIDLMAMDTADVHEIKKQMPNHEMFLDNALDILTESGGGPAGVLVMDIRHFKSVNDAHGLEVGDRAIVVYYDLLTAALARAGVPGTIGRTGGDEFAVFFMGTGEQARGLAQDFAASVEGYNFGALGIRQQMGASVGCVFTPHAGPQDLALIRRLKEKAHEALFDAWNTSNSGSTPSGVCVRPLEK